MLEPIYLDLHIHTSDDADKINENYDVKKIVSNILKYNENSKSLISLTDHNTINKKAYEELVNISEKINVLLGVELHIRNYDEAEPYHAHMFFKLDNILDSIDDINKKLDKLYQKKMVSNKDKIPHLEEIVKEFDEYDYLILPHGGQNHKTFDKSIPEGKNFDNTLERTIYYNQFDGFTSRTNDGVQDTINYFKRLNINEFINLITGTDNYKPEEYPNSKAGDSAIPFIPTWMIAEPTFDGLRISLSEQNRLFYQKNKPEISTQIIKSCYLKKDNIDIDVSLTPGLNVVIGESSSGKSLFIDSLYNKIKNDFSNSVYTEYGISDIDVNNPQGFIPHYINQNFLVDKINKKQINDIDIIKSLFPANEETKKEVDSKLSNLKTIITSLINDASKLEQLEKDLRTIPMIGKLIYKGKVQTNPINAFIIPTEIDEKTNLSKLTYDNYNTTLTEIETFSKNNLFMNDITEQISIIRKSLQIAYEKGNIKSNIKDSIKSAKEKCDTYIEEVNGENAIKQQQIEKLLLKIKTYIQTENDYCEDLKKLSEFDYKIETRSIKKGDNTLFIINELKITEDKIIESINEYIKTKYNSTKIKKLLPKYLFKNNWSQRPLVKDYNDLINKIYLKISSMNEEKYKIITKDGLDFDNLSPGWKTATILDLIFNNPLDYAPLIIDQPEDNLASTYLNGDLIKSLHKTKQKRQVIIVSHNATIPMLGDAQNVIVCKNNEENIIIRNAPLEGKLDNTSIVDIVAKLTDGGKTAIKKRFKKYNLKKYRGEEDDN